STRFQTMMTKAGIATTDEMVNAGKQQLEDIDKILAKPALAPISAEFDRLRKAKAHDVNWYVPLGPRNFAAIARAVGKEPYSATLYSLASQVMHSSSYDPHVILGTGELTFQPIRSLDKFPTVLSFSVSLTLGTYRAILQQDRSGE